MNQQGALRVLDSGQSNEWNDVLKHIGRFDFYHTADYHRLEEVRLGARAELITYSEGPHLVALPLLLSEIKIAGKSPFEGPRYVAKSVYGYVGWLVTSRTTRPVLSRFGRKLEEYLRVRGVVSLFSRMHPLLPRQNNELLVGRIENVGTTIAIDLGTGIAAYEQGLGKSHRYEIRRMREMGCEVLSDAGSRFLAEFHELYTATMKRVNAAPSYFFSHEYLNALVDSEQFQARIFKAVYHDQICAMAMFVKCDGLVQYHLSCSREGVIRYPATKLLIDEACRWSLDSRCDWLHLGGGVGARNGPLFDFKAGFGGIHVPFNVWKCIFRDNDYADLCDMVGQQDGGSDTYFPAFQTSQS